MAVPIDVRGSLPNLKVTLPIDDEPLDFSPDESMVVDMDVDVTEDQTPSTDEQVEIHRKFTSPLENLRKYENKGGGFVTGLDLSSEDVSKKLEERATRFGVENCSEKSISQAEINALYESLGINIGSTLAGLKNIRLDAVHMRGVDEMSTQEVFAYFKKYGPSSMEWINDCSCNVLWLDEMGPVRALLGLSKILESHKKTETSAEALENLKTTVDKDVTSNNEASELDEVATASNNEVPELDEVILVSESSDEDEEDKLIAFKHQKREKYVIENIDMEPGEIDDKEPGEIDDKEPGEIEESNLHEQNNSLDIPIPPGRWRVGVAHPKAKAILLRFATTDDKKLPGSEKRSQYYQKYGNPNYGGMRGLISTTRKRKIIATKKMIDVEHLSKNTDSKATAKYDVMNYVPESRKPKQIRMRMYADDEEERIKKRNENRRKMMNRSDDGNSKRSVHDRLGNPGRRFFVKPSEEYPEDEDLEETDNIRSTVFKPNSNRKVSARYNVWTSLAKSMAQESDDDDDIPFKRRVVNNSRHFAEDLQSKDDFPLPSYNLNPEGDLRSKLDKIRESANTFKNRSPLLRSK